MRRIFAKDLETEKQNAFHYSREVSLSHIKTLRDLRNERFVLRLVFPHIRSSKSCAEANVPRLNSFEQDPSVHYNRHSLFLNVVLFFHCEAL